MSESVGRSNAGAASPGPDGRKERGPRVLVTGASGFIGRHALEPLGRRGYEVHAITSGSPEGAAANVDGAASWHRLDLLDGDAGRRLLDELRPTHLLHFAWQVDGWPRNGPEVNRAWLRASLDLLDDFIGAGGRRVVMVGTCTEYDWSHGVCSEYETPKHGATHYGRYKERLRQRLEARCAEAGLSQAWGMPFFVYGPHQAANRLVPSVILSLLGRRPARCSPGEQKRDFMHVQDVADGLVALLDSEVQGPVNIASGEATAVKEIVLRLARILDGEELVDLGALPAGSEEPLVVADTGRLTRELGFHPAYDLEAGLTHTIEWWNERLSTVEGAA